MMGGHYAIQTLKQNHRDKTTAKDREQPAYVHNVNQPHYPCPLVVRRVDSCNLCCASTIASCFSEATRAVTRRRVCLFSLVMPCTGKACNVSGAIKIPMANPYCIKKDEQTLSSVSDETHTIQTSVRTPIPPRAGLRVFGVQVSSRKVDLILRNGKLDRCHRMKSVLESCRQNVHCQQVLRDTQRTCLDRPQ